MKPFHCIISCNRKNPSLHIGMLYIGIFALKMTAEIISLQGKIPFVLITTLDLETFIKGHNVYKNIWDILMEPGNRTNKFAVSGKINEKIVRHFKKDTSGRFTKTIFYFLRRNEYSSAWAKVIGKKFNLCDGERMQVHCKLILFW